jgi:hypothetical protein
MFRRLATLFIRAQLARRAYLIARQAALLALAGVRAWRGKSTKYEKRRVAAKEPLPSLYEKHPEAVRASPRELGLRIVPLDEICGTAVEGPDQRGGDFLPLPRFRSPNWQGRWQRIRNAVDRLEVLPPVELVKFGDRYWVVDGHNRVAAALRVSQVGIDAAVTELRLPGMAAEPPPETVAPVLGESRVLRAAGRGRLSTTASLPDVETPVPVEHTHAHVGDEPAT